MTMTKFEVGKKYLGGTGYEYLCTHVIDGWGVANKQCGPMNPFFMAPDGGWEEVSPPLTFGDLKVGEKFKWAGTREEHLVLKISNLDNQKGWVYLNNTENFKAGAAFFFTATAEVIRIP